VTGARATASSRFVGRSRAAAVKSPVVVLCPFASKLLLSCLFATAVVGCGELGQAPSLSRDTAEILRVGEHRPETSESTTVGAIEARVTRGSPGFERLVRNDDPDIVFKDEERTGADRMMTPRLRSALRRLDERVRRQWAFRCA
jgi:hypothetical protein